MNVLNYVAPELADLYHSLEVEFKPMKLCNKVNGILEYIEQQTEEEYKQYVEPLKKIAITRMLKQVRTYVTIFIRIFISYCIKL